jgi:hypothetical protein
MQLRNRRQKRATNYAQLCGMVDRTIDKPIFQNMKKYLIPIESKLWGEKRPRNFLEGVLYITLYHDLEAVGFCTIAKIVHRTH